MKVVDIVYSATYLNQTAIKVLKKSAPLSDRRDLIVIGLK